MEFESIYYHLNNLPLYISKKEYSCQLVNFKYIVYNMLGQYMIAKDDRRFAIKYWQSLFCKAAIIHCKQINSTNIYN